MLKAIKDRIIIKIDEVKNEKLILNDDYLRRESGVVVDVGDKVNSVKVGEHIIFHVFDEISLDDYNLAVIREKSVLAKIE